MKVLVTGVNGQLGHDVLHCLLERGIEAVGAGRAEFDITDFEAARRFIIENKADAVIHCSAYTAVDKAEDEKDLCFLVNAEATRNIAGICKELDIKMLYISTDYVFSGKGDHYYETDHKAEPLGVYGASKLQGEAAVQELLQKYFIVRISWVFGSNGNNFVKTMLRLGKEKQELNVVKDQFGSPTYTKDLAELLCDMIVSEKYGVYHATNEGICSWSEFAEEIMRCSGLSTKVNGILSQEYPTRAARPKNSRLSKASLDRNGFTRLPDWKDALERYLRLGLYCEEL